jgi:hypothetical protein
VRYRLGDRRGRLLLGSGWDSHHQGERGNREQSLHVVSPFMKKAGGRTSGF